MEMQKVCFDTSSLCPYMFLVVQIDSRDYNWQSAWRTMNGGSWHCTWSGDQNHPQEKEMRKGKTVVWGGFTDSWEKKRIKRQRRKGKIYPSECKVPKNIATSGKKAFLSNQCKEIEENNRMGRTRDLFKKIRDMKRIFHTKMGTIKTETVCTYVGLPNCLMYFD